MAVCRRQLGRAVHPLCWRTVILSSHKGNFCHRKTAWKKISVIGRMNKTFSLPRLATLRRFRCRKAKLYVCLLFLDDHRFVCNWKEPQRNKGKVKNIWVTKTFVMGRTLTSIESNNSASEKCFILTEPPSVFRISIRLSNLKARKNWNTIN